MTTKEKILDAALTLFSERGYDPVSVRDIAAAVGIKESSLYNHFKNKQDIFDTIVTAYTDRWAAIFQGLSLTDSDRQFVVDERMVNMYRDMTPEQFSVIGGLIFDAYMTDDVNVKFRRLLTLEQYRSPALAALFRRVSFDDSIGFQAQLFKALMAAGCFVEKDPYILALEFFSPIFLLFYKFGSEPESVQAAKALFLRHIAHFNETYGVKRGAGQ
ncbi:TetR/AcrR family transcriptional regulator [Oscillospiraceae bacterium WX1]